MWITTHFDQLPRRPGKGDDITPAERKDFEKMTHHCEIGIDERATLFNLKDRILDEEAGLRTVKRRHQARGNLKKWKKVSQRVNNCEVGMVVALNNMRLPPKRPEKKSVAEVLLGFSIEDPGEEADDEDKHQHSHSCNNTKAHTGKAKSVTVVEKKRHKQQPPQPQQQRREGDLTGLGGKLDRLDAVLAKERQEKAAISATAAQLSARMSQLVKMKTAV